MIEIFVIGFFSGMGLIFLILLLLMGALLLIGKSPFKLFSLSAFAISRPLSTRLNPYGKTTKSSYGLMTTKKGGTIGSTTKIVRTRGLHFKVENPPPRSSTRSILTKLVNMPRIYQTTLKMAENTARSFSQNQDARRFQFNKQFFEGMRETALAITLEKLKIDMQRYKELEEKYRSNKLSKQEREEWRKIQETLMKTLEEVAFSTGKKLGEKFSTDPKKLESELSKNLFAISLTFGGIAAEETAKLVGDPEAIKRMRERVEQRANRAAQELVRGALLGLIDANKTPTEALQIIKGGLDAYKGSQTAILGLFESGMAGVFLAKFKKELGPQAQGIDIIWHRPAKLDTSFLTQTALEMVAYKEAKRVTTTDPQEIAMHLSNFLQRAKVDKREDELVTAVVTAFSTSMIEEIKNKEETVSFLKKLQESLKKEGYKLSKKPEEIVREGLTEIAYREGKNITTNNPQQAVEYLTRWLEESGIPKRSSLVDAAFVGFSIAVTESMKDEEEKKKVIEDMRETMKKEGYNVREKPKNIAERTVEPIIPLPTYINDTLNTYESLEKILWRESSNEKKAIYDTELDKKILEEQLQRRERKLKEYNDLIASLEEQLQKPLEEKDRRRIESELEEIRKRKEEFERSGASKKELQEDIQTLEQKIERSQQKAAILEVFSQNPLTVTSLSLIHPVGEGPRLPVMKGEKVPFESYLLMAGIPSLKSPKEEKTQKKEKDKQIKIIKKEKETRSYSSSSSSSGSSSQSSSQSSSSSSSSSKSSSSSSMFSLFFF